MKYLALAAVAATLAAPAFAEGMYIGSGATTLGPVIEGSYQIKPNLGLRGFFIGGLKSSSTDTVTSEDGTTVWDATIEGALGGLGAVADYHVMGGGWRVSGGLFLSTSSMNGEFTDLAGTDSFSADFGFAADVAPVVSTGYTYAFANGLTLSGDVGFILSPMKATSDLNDAGIQSDIADLNNDLSATKAFPLISLTAGYSF